MLIGRVLSQPSLTMLCRKGVSQLIAATTGSSRHRFLQLCHRRTFISPIPKLAANNVCASYRDSAAATASPQKSVLGETGAHLLVEALEREGVTDVFGDPSSYEDAWWFISSALERSKKIRFSNHMNDSYPLHGDKALVSAMTYAHLSSTGLPAVCCVNSIGTKCLQEVALSKVPVVIIIYDGYSHSSDISSTKGRFQVLDVPDIPRVVKQAFSLASSGPRPGLVVIDISSKVTLPTGDAESLLYRKFDWIISSILYAKRPVLYMDGGCLSRSSEEVRRFMELTGGMPLASNLNGLSSYLRYHNNNGHFSLQMLGDGCVDYAVRESDLLLLLGVQYNDALISHVVKENRDMTVIHIIEDGEKLPEIQEEEENMAEYIPIFSDVKLALRVINEILEMMKTLSLENPDRSAWREDCYFATSSVSNPQDKSIEPHHVTQILNELNNKGEAKLIISTSGIYKNYRKSSLVAEFYEQIKPDECLDGWEAAIGAAVFSSSVPDSPIVVHIDAFRWSKSHWEFGLTERVRKPKSLPIKIITIDYKCRNPLDWTEVSEINDMPRACVSERAELREAIKKMLATPGSYFLQVVVIPKPVVSNCSSTGMSIVNGILV